MNSPLTPVRAGGAGGVSYSFAVDEFRRYSDSVGADRYRVTAIKSPESGGRLAFVLGAKEGFTPREIEQRMPEMLRLQARGENIYYTPLSAAKHHILIDDLCIEKLKRLIRDGYKPAVLLESSPGNFQAVISILKLSTPHDKAVGNRLSAALNQEFGDPKLSGGVHPHRAPGFQNRKPKYQREDGSYPQVRLLKAERRECGKTLVLSREIDREFQRQAALKARQPVGKSNPALPLAAASGSAADAYRRHSRDVLARWRGRKVDLSRVDSMAAVRMRVTGHPQPEIENAIRECAPSIRAESVGRNWADYAARTALYAWSAQGDRQVMRLGEYRQSWEQLEKSK